MKRIYDLKLHETITIMPWEITRVAGGWLYVYANNPNALVTTFVPYNNEFDEGVC
jgi:hypothetical protein